MENNSNGIAWFGDVYRKLETICLEAEGVVWKEGFKYVEDQVQTVGENVKQFCTEFAREVLPESLLVDNAVSGPPEIETSDGVNQISIKSMDSDPLENQTCEERVSMEAISDELIKHTHNVDPSEECISSLMHNKFEMSLVEKYSEIKQLNQEVSEKVAEEDNGLLSYPASDFGESIPVVEQHNLGVPAASPPILPISNAQPTSVASAVADPPVATPAFRAFVNRITESVRSGLSQRKPWAELADRSAFSKPESFSDAAVRVRKNYSYFRVNYLAVIGVILAFSLVTNPWSLFMLVGLLASWIFLYLFRPSDQPLVILGRSYSDRETLGILVILSIVVVFLTSVGSILISALLTGVGIVCVHGAFRQPEDLFLDDQEAASTGFLSFLGGAASNAAAAAAPVVAATRV